MYESFFGLEERPFTLTPNPRYVFYSDRYRGALEQLRYGLEQKEGFLLLTGVVGTGKTTLCRDLLGQLDRGRFRTGPNSQKVYANVVMPFAPGISVACRARPLKWFSGIVRICPSSDRAR